MPETPIISFVTPCFNRRDFLVRCIESIPAAYRSRVEHIIIDGGSTDGSVELVKSYPHVRLLSETDRGLYDAANKGIYLAQGKYVGFLATDDFISSSFFTNFFDGSNDWQLDVSAMSFNFVNHVGEARREYSAATFDLESIFHGRASIFSMLIQRNILIGLSGFNASYRIAGDFDLALRLFRLGMTSKLSPYSMQNFWMHDGSLTGHSGSARDHEYGEIVRCVSGNLLSLATKPGFYPLARQKMADVARYFYRTRRFKSIFLNWRLVLLILVMGVNFR